ncbi:MAG: class I tRNA ligase family protein, partial [Alphaproteobacteria bacterium]
MDEPARHALTLYDSKSRSKRVFVPLDEKNVRMYVCGPTVYDHPHIGNARPVVVFDALFRLLRFLYGEDAVCYIRNITDIDDKIINAAKEKNLTIAQLTQMVEEQFHLETRELLCLEVSASPRATEYIKEMQEIIRTLLEKGAAYEAEGHVLFDVSR